MNKPNLNPLLLHSIYLSVIISLLVFTILSLFQNIEVAKISYNLDQKIDNATQRIETITQNVSSEIQDHEAKTLTALNETLMHRALQDQNETGQQEDITRLQDK